MFTGTELDQNEKILHLFDTKTKDAGHCDYGLNYLKECTSVFFRTGQNFLNQEISGNISW